MSRPSARAGANGGGGKLGGIGDDGRLRSGLATRPLFVVALGDLVERRVEERVLSVVVQRNDALERGRPRTRRLLHELACSREDRLHHSTFAAATTLQPTSDTYTPKCSGSAALWSAQNESRLKRSSS
jgi:hypothetical protein